MKPPLYLRPLTEEERRTIQVGLRSSDAFTLRRAQIFLASAAGKKVSEIARDLHVDEDTVLRAIHAFDRRGLQALSRGSSRPKTLRFAVAPEREAALRGILHQSPRTFGKESSLWSLNLLAEVAFEQGLAPRKLTPQGMKDALERFGIQWQRAKRWITSPDPAYERKKAPGTDC